MPLELFTLEIDKVLSCFLNLVPIFKVVPFTITLNTGHINTIYKGTIYHRKYMSGKNISNTGDI